MSPRAARPAVFLDRDGTLVEERDFVLKPEELVLLPGAASAVARLNRAGYAVVLVTNQSAIGRGMIGENELDAIHAHLARELARAGARLDRIEYCPDHPTEGRGRYRRDSDRRKPGPRMLLDAAEALGLDLARSWTVGDAERDLAAGRGAGVRPILVATGKGERERARLAAEGAPPEVFVADLAAAVDHLLRADAEVSGRAQGR